MGKQKPKVVDLELTNGVYTSTEHMSNSPRLNIEDVKPYQDTLNIKNVKPLAVTKKKEKPKQKNVDSFLGGIDAGLDLIEQVVPRVERFLKLRG